jgi:hypothetical protein
MMVQIFHTQNDEQRGSPLGTLRGSPIVSRHFE